MEQRRNANRKAKAAVKKLEAQQKSAKPVAPSKQRATQVKLHLKDKGSLSTQAAEAVNKQLWDEMYAFRQPQPQPSPQPRACVSARHAAHCPHRQCVCVALDPCHCVLMASFFVFLLYWFRIVAAVALLPLPVVFFICFVASGHSHTVAAAGCVVSLLLQIRTTICKGCQV